MPDEMNKDEIRIRQILANVPDYVLARQFSVASAGEATERLADALLKAGSIEKVGVKDIEKNIKIMSDEKIEKAPNPEYAGAYNQGKFDVLMEIKRLNKLKEKE